MECTAEQTAKVLRTVLSNGIDIVAMSDAQAAREDILEFPQVVMSRVAEVTATLAPESL